METALVEQPNPAKLAGGMPRPRILIIEDERALTKVLAYNFEREGYEPIVAHDGDEGLRKAQTLLPDFIILDLMLPTRDGLEICRALRANERTQHIPVLMLTARAEETDQIVGFSMAADDYVTKPFSVKVLLQRIKALRRRAEPVGEPADVIEHLGIRIDRVRHRVLVGKRELDLTPTEFRLMDAAIGEGAVVLERTIDVHVKSLRRKLGDPDLIETVRGIGYRFRESAE